jgi:PIN domain nuclease of toxin-antitoxin system
VDAENEVFASAVSAWEIAIKSELGKLDADLDEIIEESRAAGFLELPVRMTHAARLRDLRPVHSDPFDRLLIAQAITEGLTLVSRDRIVSGYGVATFWR